MRSPIASRNWWLTVVAGTGLLAMGIATGCDRPGAARKPDFPRKPITIVVYTAPGGLIDITARKFADVATKHELGVFAVENVPGAGGMVAIQHVLENPADGYTLFAVTRSVVSKLVETGTDHHLQAFDWEALLIREAECVITRTGAPLETWEQLAADARQRPGAQLWLGPDVGGLDHVFAIKLWDKAGIRGQWIPFSSGGEAMTALLGGQGPAYVGNPSDIADNPQFRVAAVAGVARSPLFPDAPTFSELGVPGLDHDAIWRGFVLKHGTPASVRDWYAEVFRTVAADPEWRAFWERSGIEVCCEGPERFAAVVAADRDEFRHYLAAAGLTREDEPTWLERWTTGVRARRLGAFGALLYAVVLVVAALRGGRAFGRIAVPTGLLLLALFAGVFTLGFPQEQGIGATAAPRLWASLLALLAVGLLAVRPAELKLVAAADRRTALAMFAWTALLTLGIWVAGYWLASLVFGLVTPRLLGERRWGPAILSTAIWLGCSWLIFSKLLYVPLPLGLWWRW